SVRFEYGASVSWFNTAGWHCEPMETTDFTFPPFDNYPATIRLAGNFMGLPFVQEIYRPVRDTWYPFDPPHEQTSAMFTAPSAILEPGRTSPVPFLSIVPAIVRDAATIRTSGTGTLELFDPTGRPVLRLDPAPESFRWSGTADDGRLLPEGIYFCRLSTETGVTLRKVLIAR
ncbi:MAG: hypothetical protein ABIK37_05575, partial [candidate division WOR-3 bacterium]